MKRDSNDMADKKDVGSARRDDAMRIDPALVRELAHLLTENELTEIEVEDGERKIKVKREPAAVIAAAAPAPPQPAPAPAAAPAAGAQGSAATADRKSVV